MENLSNGAQSTINMGSGISSSATTLTVTSATGFPAANFRIIVDSEIMIVTAVSTNDFTVTRGAESTTGATHANGATVTQILTLAGLLQYLRDHIFKAVFGGSGTPLVATDVTNWFYVNDSVSVSRLTLSCKSAPTGSFQITIKRSSDSGSTFPDTIATVTVSSGSKLATTTTMTNSSLVAGDYLRCDVISVNGAADWSVRLT